MRIFEKGLSNCYAVCVKCASCSNAQQFQYLATKAIQRDQTQAKIHNLLIYHRSHWGVGVGQAHIHSDDVMHSLIPCTAAFIECVLCSFQE